MVRYPKENVKCRPRVLKIQSFFIWNLPAEKNIHRNACGQLRFFWQASQLLRQFSALFVSIFCSCIAYFLDIRMTELKNICDRSYTRRKAVFFFAEIKPFISSSIITSTNTIFKNKKFMLDEMSLWNAVKVAYT